MNDEYVPYPATIVIDANTFISATLTPGITREMLRTTEDELYSSAFIRDTHHGGDSRPRPPGTTGD
jgi:hypothetical protein